MKSCSHDASIATETPYRADVTDACYTSVETRRVTWPSSMNNAQLEPLSLRRKTDNFWFYLFWALVAVIVTMILLLWGGVLVSEPSKSPSFVGVSYWTIMQGISSLAAASALMGSAIFALMQHSSARRDRHLTVYNEMFTRLMSTEQVEARRWVYETFKFDAAATPAQVAAIVAAVTDAHKREYIRRASTTSTISASSCSKAG
jgi:hypothetical protein